MKNVKVGDFVVGFLAVSDNTCEICQAGYHGRCANGSFVHGTIGTQSSTTASRCLGPYVD